MREAAFDLTLGVTAFLLTVIWGGPFIELLKRFKIGKQIRVDGPQTHFTKMGTPTMGGLLFIVPVLGITAVLNVVNLVKPVIGRSILLPLGILVAFALLGAVDDWEGLRGRRSKTGEGMLGRYKFLYQWVLAGTAGVMLYFFLGVHSLALPGNPFKINIGLIYIPIAAFIIVGTSNAVNIIDGLDGLAGLISATAFAAYGLIAVLQGQFFLARFCYTLVGALFAFLWFNAHPAQLMMGDTGALALGATLGTVSLMTGQWLLLPIIAIIPVSGTLSVILQVTYFKWTGGKRLLKMAPLHHHLELSGWSETQIVQRFWLVGLLGAMVGIGLALL
ncbi:MAG TPA: phospho-N-acetylmuramoyl-pentapeptide-transferase [Anaerolineales bacterium]|nr:phospho-N-acetylmuramoyl-pentapeptide-transferase [Anaerolineales bacterium]HLB50300.1 phospho-N-acetylmuramoyl-pentapeptide-transferase [Anaerolineales bacterium]